MKLGRRQFLPLAGAAIAAPLFSSLAWPGTSTNKPKFNAAVVDEDPTPVFFAGPRQRGIVEIPAELLAAKASWEPKLLSLPGVAGIGVGLREESGILFEEPSLRVYITDRSCTWLGLPEEIAGFAVSIIKRHFTPCMAEPCAAEDLSRQQTLMGGIRIANPAIGFGTLSAVVQALDSDQLLGLSCFHVVGPPGNVFPLTVWQPDSPPVAVVGGQPPSATDNIGHVERVDFPQTLTPTIPFELTGVVDAAVFSLGEARTQGRRFSPAILGQNAPDLLVDRVTRTTKAVLGQEVRKRGFRTRVTLGRVICIGMRCGKEPWTSANTGNTFLIDQAEILSTTDCPFAAEGDSGSLVLDRFAPTAVGLLWATNTRGRISVMSEITTVESQLGIRVVWN